MKLPKIDVPTQEVVVPSTKQTITIRPFLVKEEKVLLTALASNEYKDVIQATKQVVQNCIVSPDFDVNKISLCDLEYLILQLRIMSIGNTLKLRFSPIENSECEQCKKVRTVEVDLADACVMFNETHKHQIQLTNTIGVMLKDPEARMMETFEKAKQSDDVDDLFRAMWSCVECVYDEDSQTSAKDVSVQDGMQFLESLTGEQFKKISEFFETLPKLHLSVKIKCDKCDYEDSYVMERLEDFFG